MSSLIYGIVTAKRAAAPAGQSQTTSGPAMGTYVDAVAALVPAEALALYAAVVIPYTTRTASVSGKNTTVISDPRLLQWSCAGLFALCGLLYLVGRQKAPFTLSDVVRFLIPPMALAAWLLIQNFGVWDIWWPGSDLGERTVIVAFGAVLLGIVASRLGLQADATPGTLAVTGISPNTGSVAGGAHLTVTGSGFTGVNVVKFGTVPAPVVAFGDDTNLTVTSPPGAAAGTVNVTVTTGAGTSPVSKADHFVYEVAGAPAPAVSGISPNTGSAAGGDNVTITGRGFTGVTGARFGQVLAPSVVLADDTTLTVTTPEAPAAGTVDVTVTTGAGTSPVSAADHFTYEAATVPSASAAAPAVPVPPAAAETPAVTGISPARGLVAGGANVTVIGSGFNGATAVNFGQVPAPDVAVASNTKLTVTSPQAAAAGAVDVTVTTTAGTSPTSPADLFTYELLPSSPP